MPLKHKLTVPSTQFDCRINTRGNAGGFKNDIGTFRRNLL